MAGMGRQPTSWRQTPKSSVRFRTERAEVGEMASSARVECPILVIDRALPMPHSTPTPSLPAVIIGGGPAGLMAAEVLALAGIKVELFDAMPSVGRKFLLAGVGGMNITHAEPTAAFLGRYGERRDELAKLLHDFGAEQLRAWIHGLGIDTFVGSSGRVFPTDMKAAPLLRAWLKRLRELGVTIHTRSRWLGWNADGSLRIATAEGESAVNASATLLALGGGSWARLGSDGAWLPLLADRGVPLAALQPSNCGFEVAGWSLLFKEKFEIGRASCRERV